MKRKPLKSLELAWKAVWLAFFTTLAKWTHRASPEPDWRRDPVRILFLRPDRIGDAIISSGIFREIVRHAPNVTLDVLGTPRNEAILRSSPYLATVHVFDRSHRAGWLPLVRRLRAARYDAVVDCMVTAPSMTTLLLMIASGARHRIGIAGRGIDRALTVRVPANPGAVHIIEHLAALGTPFGAAAEHGEWRPELTVPEEDRVRAMEWWGEGGEGFRVPRVLVNVSAGKPARNWPEDRFAAAVAHLRSRLGKPEVLIIGAPGESDRVERIAALAGARPVATPRVADMIALVSTATFLLTPDTSVAHVASATGTPAVVIYLAGTSSIWGLYESPGISLEAPGRTLADYPLQPVLDAMDRMLVPAG